ncbi:hypothetical protein [Actimicrobium sp. CCI2.3]|uniref:hypothetical protein n=1 Tax=Actimicrobium sp. CCI2.3 TaxID=3048616 RepID=UPI002AB46446|nr:hypothetical protein [Actimicrobium sp. CCI2.3]MDY7573404.1 hypothetical protein [Actimicrobium sp. CCI2.3]MEB0021802.1 hypothetical protein [Actimicrobium sp. CCI2.3]
MFDPATNRGLATIHTSAVPSGRQPLFLDHANDLQLQADVELSALLFIDFSSGGGDFQLSRSVPAVHTARAITDIDSEQQHTGPGLYLINGTRIEYTDMSKTVLARSLCSLEKILQRILIWRCSSFFQAEIFARRKTNNPQFPQ